MQSAAYDNPIASENVSILILWLATKWKTCEFICTSLKLKHPMVICNPEYMQPLHPVCLELLH